MVHVTNGPNIAMRLGAFEFLLGHGTLRLEIFFRASGELRLDLRGDCLGYLFVVIELHGEGGASL
jgi:hypothetical protein